MNHCVICYKTVEEDEELEICTSCGSIFHTNCYKISLLQSKKCPYCRDSIFRKIYRRVIPEGSGPGENMVFEVTGPDRGRVLAAGILSPIMISVTPLLLFIKWYWAVITFVTGVALYYEMQNQWMSNRYILFRYQVRRMQRKIVSWVT